MREDTTKMMYKKPRCAFSCRGCCGVQCALKKIVVRFGQRIFASEILQEALISNYLDFSCPKVIIKVEVCVDLQ